MFFNQNCFRTALALTALIAMSSGSTALSQGGSPIPGGTGAVSSAMTAPTPGSVAQAGAPTPGRGGVKGKGMAYADLPLSTDDAKARILELKGLVPTTRPQEMQDRVNQLCEWLGDMVEAHNRMANAFAKHDQLKAQALSERQSAQGFAQLKNQAQLLKADLLINMHRFPEALGPLVDIVIAEPTSGTGQAAYKRLQQLGFSAEVTEVAETAAEAKSAPVAVKKTTASVAPKKTAPAPAERAPKRTGARRH